MKRVKLDNKGQVINPLVAGIGGLVILIIVMFVIVTSVSDAGLFEGLRLSATFPNEVTTVINDTAITFGNVTLSGSNCVADAILNNTGSGVIAAGNFTVVSEDCTIQFTSTGSGDQVYNGTILKINSTTTYDSREERSSNGLKDNMTEGVNNVSEKVPTVLKVAAVVLLLGVLVFLYQRARPIIGSNAGSL